MTDTTEHQPTASNLPSHIGYQVRDRKGAKAIWTPIGAAWPQKDGGFKVQVHAVPLDGLIILRFPSEKPEKSE
jgi:hypothetical protein